MIAPYSEAVYQALGGVVDLFTRLALPLAICLGLIALAGALLFALRGDNAFPPPGGWRPHAANAAGYAAVGLLAVAGWAVLRSIHPVARQDIHWRESAAATANPTPDAPAVYQFGPAVAALVERTYTRTLTLPPVFLERVGAEGVGVLAPYLSDPSAENVLRLVDTFRRSGRDVVFTRQVTRLDEEPLPFTGSHIRVRFRRLSGRAFDTEFEGRYAFQNTAAQPITARFLFALPQAGTIRDLHVRVGEQTVTEPNDSGGYEWTRRLEPGERREAVVRYRVLGTSSWHYDLGSRRRRVQQFRLEAVPGGPVRFLRGSLQPTTRTQTGLLWELDSVVTAQQVALAFPPEISGQESYLQALSALPASFVVFLVGVLAIGWRFGQAPGPGRLAGALALFAFGLGASAIVANYLGAVVGVILAPLAGAFASARVLGRRWLAAAVPAALLPATFLSPQHSGLLVLLLALLALAGAFLILREKAELANP